MVVLLGCNHSLMHSVEAVLDTGTGRNVVRELMLLSDWRRYGLSTFELPRIRDANNRRLNVDGALAVHLDIRGQPIRQSFLAYKDAGDTCNLWIHVYPEVR